MSCVRHAEGGGTAAGVGAQNLVPLHGTPQLADPSGARP